MKHPAQGIVLKQKAKTTGYGITWHVTAFVFFAPFFRKGNVNMKHLAQGIVLKQRAKSVGSGLLQYLVPLLFFRKENVSSKASSERRSRAQDSLLGL